MPLARDQFDQIVRQQQRHVYRVLYTLLRDPDAADTLTQECFLRAHQKLASFRGECRLQTWILRIAVNLARDHIKSRRASFWRRLIGLEGTEGGAAGEYPAPEPSPERVLLAREELQAVWASVDALSPQQRTIFLLRFSEEMPLSQIADLLGLRIGSVKAQLFRAIATVRQKMKEKQWR